MSRDRSRRRWPWLLAALAVLVVAIVFATPRLLQHRLISRLEAQGHEARADDVDVLWLEGAIRVEGLQVTTRFGERAQVPRLTVAVHPGSLLGEGPVVADVHLASPDLVIPFEGLRERIEARFQRFLEAPAARVATLKVDDGRVRVTRRSGRDVPLRHVTVRGRSLQNRPSDDRGSLHVEARVEPRGQVRLDFEADLAATPPDFALDAGARGVSLELAEAETRRLASANVEGGAVDGRLVARTEGSTVDGRLRWAVRNAEVEPKEDAGPVGWLTASFAELGLDVLGDVTPGEETVGGDERFQVKASGKTLPKTLEDTVAAALRKALPISG